MVVHVIALLTGSGVIQIDIKMTDEHFEESPQKRNPHTYILSCSAQVSVVLPFPILHIYCEVYYMKNAILTPQSHTQGFDVTQIFMQRSIVNTKNRTNNHFI